MVARCVACIVVAYTALPCIAHTLESPDGRVKVAVQLDHQGPQSSVHYAMTFDGVQVLDKSGITFTLPDGTTIGNSLSETAKAQTSSHDSTWTPVYGEKSTIRDHYNQLQLEYIDQASSYRVQLTLRCYDAGLAFQTTLHAPDTSQTIRISKEHSEFRFVGDPTVWCTPKAQGACSKQPLSSVSINMERPLTLQVEDDLYAAVLEAGLVDYAAMKLSRCRDDAHCLQTSLLSSVKGEATLQTPWRVVMVGRSPGELLENNALVMNLSEPCAIADTTWIKPGKVLREITLTTDGALASVDFAAKHNFKYIEFDAGWYGHEYDNNSDATTVTVDPKRSPGPLDLPHVIDYAAQRDIGIIVYVNRRHLEKQLDDILPLYQKWGIKGVKYGFVNTGSQQWTSWLHEAIRKAADHKLMVDVHDEYRPVGYSRTYPNLMSQEGVRGDEAAPASNQAIITLFTRNLAGAADHTICYFNPRVDEHWTHGHQLGKAVCTYSPWQFMFWYDSPLSSRTDINQASIVDTPELEFFAKVPTVWDETKVLRAAIGEYVVIARRSGDDWFVGMMNNGTPRDVDIPLDFLDPNHTYQARVYKDDPSLTTRTKVRVDSQQLTSADRLGTPLLANGGQAIWLTPAGQSTTAATMPQHLFILSGQSNMAGLDPKLSFIPTVNAKYGEANVVVVKDAQGGQPIRRWYKEWIATDGTRPKSTGDLYDRLMEKVKPHVDKQRFDSVTLVWMQGESDARMQEAGVYADSLQGLVSQVADDLGRNDINVVIGRISDFDMDNQEMKHWTRIREAQLEFVDNYPRATLVDTDDLNDGVNKRGKPIQNDLHYSVEGYKTLGQRFADSAIQLIEQHNTRQAAATEVRR